MVVIPNGQISLPVFHKVQFLARFYSSHGRSHGSVTKGRRVKSMGECKITPLTTPTPLNRQSRKYRTRDYVHHITPQATFGQDRPRGYSSPYSQSYQSFFITFFVRKNLSTDLELRLLNRFCHAIHQQTRIHAG